jgi:hypothetical protein
MPRYFLEPECTEGAKEIKGDFRLKTVKHADVLRLVPPRHRLVIEIREGSKAPLVHLDVHEAPDVWARYRDMFCVSEDMSFRVLAVKAAVARKLRQP